MTRLSLFLLPLTLLIACGDKAEDTSSSTVDTDADGDGFTTDEGDCDDSDAAINPDADEVCDGTDNNCDGTADEGVTGTFYADADGDGHGDASVTTAACVAPAGYTESSDDCDDTSADISPDADEVCNDADDNCDGTVDEDTATDALIWYADADGDGYGDLSLSVRACVSPSGYTDSSDDCDDTDARFNPGADESDCTDPSDYNCDGSVAYADADADGFAACAECDDSSADINPDADEVCDEVDNDCDGDTDEDDATDALIWYADADGDGHGDAGATTAACAEPEGYTESSDDCDDSRDDVSPDGEEVCDEADNDCDGDTDEDAADALTWYGDGDGDGYGDVDDVYAACSQPGGTVSNSDDCDDADKAVSPGASEVCDEVDNNCDGTADEGVTGTFYADDDGDGYGDASDATGACTAPGGTVSNSDDCDDTDKAVSPDAEEVCDTIDNDCDGSTDGSDAADAVVWYADADADGYGNPDEADAACSQPGGYTDNSEDCDDTDAAINPDAEEVWFDGVDADCDAFDGFTIDYLSAGDLVITEIMPNPDAVSDTYGEWLEVYNSSGVEVNLIGLVLTDNASSDTVDIDLIVPAGGYVVLGIDGDTTRNGGVTVDFDWTGPALGNSGDTLALSYDTVTFDAVNYTGWTVRAGISFSLSSLALDATSNDDSSNWCDATGTYGDGDYGSPGEENPEECLPDEDDLDGDGYTTDEDCDDTDADINPGADEVCDEVDNDCDESIDEDDAIDAADWYGDLDEDGYGDPAEVYTACSQPSGYTDNSADCDDTDATINPDATEISGDGIDQDCDGADDISTTLAVTDLVAGDLLVTEVMQNPDAVADSDGEWFEVYNSSGSDVDLSGLVVKDSGSNTFTVSGTLVVSAGGYVLFGKSSDTALNGDVAIDYAFGTKMDLGNGSDSIILLGGSTTIDSVAWDNGATFPDPTGASMSLDPDAWDSTSNDTGSSWCEATSTYGDGDLGTPGAANDDC